MNEALDLPLCIPMQKDKSGEPTPPKQIKETEQRLRTLLEECEQHQSDSEMWLSPIRDTWDEKEAMLIGQPEDSISKNTKSRVNEPRLATITFERSARVMAQNPKGKFYGVSGDDLGKNMLMNLLVNYYRNKANEQYPHLIKLRMLDYYSLVYGTMFAMVPWRVNTRTGYIGPELLLINMRDAFPQPGIRNLNEADWFTVRNVVSIEWLKSQDPKTWLMGNIEELDRAMKGRKDPGDGQGARKQQYTSYVERHMYPNVVGDLVYPKVELFTEYRGDKWITWTALQIDDKKSRPYILRLVENPYPEGMLPIVAKHAFPLIDSPIGLGEFERGKSLQYALNSLWNLYLDGVKYSIFPPLMVDPTNVVPSSIKYGAGNRWYMNNPGKDVIPATLNPQGMATFQNTYDYLVSALHSQSGTTNINSAGEDPGSLGKTPDAIKFYAAAESARDEWDRFMMEECLKDIYTRWGLLIPQKLEASVTTRLFGDEIRDIEQTYPDVKEFYAKTETGAPKRGIMNIDKSMLDSQYDFQLEAGSTFKANIESEQQNITSVMKAVLENQQLLPEIRAKGKDIDMAELMKRWIIAGGIKDWDKILVDYKQAVQNGPTDPADPNANAPIDPAVDPTAVVAEGEQTAPVEEPVVTEEVPPAPTEGEGDFKDPEIAAAAAEVFGGIPGIPVDEVVPPAA